MEITSIAPLVLLLPFLMFIFLGLTAHKFSGQTSAKIGTTAFGIVAILCYYIAGQYFFGNFSVTDANGFEVFNKTGEVYNQMTIFNWTWMQMTENLVIHIGFYLDPISAMMLVVIATVSLMVHIYSYGYMFEHGHFDEGMSRYYAVLSLFSFAMLGLVLATNIFQMYIFWELVGVSSFLLIGYYFFKPAAVSACKKAFIVTRFADMFFLIGILILSYHTQTFDFDKLNADNAKLVIESFAITEGCRGITFLGFPLITIATFCIFLGGAGKSAMFPFHIWLPDAMEGPTPSSALIHAATMVVAGVFLVARLFPVYSFSAPEVLNAICYIGAFTALFAAIIAVAQTDIKRVLAFSTISQIAYMMVALGVARFGNHETELGFTASMMHLFTHAMFKAMLFLCCGCIIHCVESNEMSKMGGLWKYMPKTAWCFLIGCLAIAGIPPFSGFFSKGEILSACMENGYTAIYVVMTFTAGLTAFYMFRLFFHIFFYEENPEYATSHHKPHDQGWQMTLPLIVFAVVTVVFFLLPGFNKAITATRTEMEMPTNWTVEGISIAVALLGIGIAYLLYFKKNEKPANIMAKCPALCEFVYNRMKIDEIWYGITRSFIFGVICKAIAWFDHNCIDGFMNFCAFVTQKTSLGTKDAQSGNVQQYVWVFIMGVITIAFLALY
ncbi:MAG: NADH-quinone oxidoreductase subunit L [Paludibacteraceae bacterium]|nr:NADH-quinone oxidoreductase subunit L [Paludibacteraceae bacterium]